jgi:hypothetical protein
LRAYFLEGEIPEYGTVCETGMRLLDSTDLVLSVYLDPSFPFSKKDDKVTSMSEEDKQLLKAWQELGEVVIGNIRQA